MQRRYYSRSPRERTGDDRDGRSGRAGSSAARRPQDTGRDRPAEGSSLTWKKMDLHLHTPAPSDYRDPGISYLDVLKKAEEKGLDMIAFADHNTVGGYAAMHREVETLTLLEKLGRINEQERATL